MFSKMSTCQWHRQMLSAEWRSCVAHFVIIVCQAKEMVAISKSISTKIKEKQGDITDDEVGVGFSSCLCLTVDIYHGYKDSISYCMSALLS